MENLARKFAEHPVKFILVYTREPHSNEGVFKDVNQPTDYDTRHKYAQRTCSELNVEREVLIDSMDGEVQKLYGGLPNMLYILDSDGKVVYHNRWADEQEVDSFLNGILKK